MHNNMCADKKRTNQMRKYNIVIASLEKAFFFG
jgi:hypothetical protein